MELLHVAALRNLELPEAIKLTACGCFISLFFLAGVHVLPPVTAYEGACVKRIASQPTDSLRPEKLQSPGSTHVGYGEAARDDDFKSQFPDPRLFSQTFF